MSFRVAAAIGVAATMLALAAGPLFAHEGDDHGQPPAFTGGSPGFRAESTSGRVELVAVARNGVLEIYLDDFATNAPLENASVEVETPQGPEQAVTHPGRAYRLEAAFLATPGKYDLIATVTAGDVIEVLPFTLDMKADGARSAAAAPSIRSRLMPFVQPTTLAGVGLGALLGFVLARLLARRRRPSTALLVLLFFGSVLPAARAHEGHDHGDQAAPIGPTGELAQRLKDGTIFIPKPLQRVFAIRTVIADSDSYRRSVELPGRIIPDPNASGFVQASVGGRLTPPAGGFPRLGTFVKAGDVLAYVTPPLQAIDVSDMRQRQGELDQQISIVERRLARYEQLAPGGAVARSQLEDTKLELQGLKDRRASLDTVRRDPEPLVAPVSGVIADGTPVAGQIAQSNAVIFHIIDPARLWVEALSFDALSDPAGASAQTASGKSLPLAYRGSGFADRNQTVPVHFAIEGNASGLRAGQFVTVFVGRDDGRNGLAVPRTALVRSANGQDFVFEHITAERFAPRAVRIEALDGERVLVLAGIEPGKRIVVQGAELIDHVR